MTSTKTSFLFSPASTNNLNYTNNKNLITLPLLSSLPSSTTKIITKKLLQQCWALSILNNFFITIVNKKKNKCKGSNNNNNHDHHGGIWKGWKNMNHFLFHNLCYSNNLMIRQSCIMTLLNGVEGDDENDGDGDSDEEGSRSDNEQQLQLGSGEDTTMNHDDCKNNNCNPQTKKKWNYKLILRHVIWDMIQEDFQSFLLQCDKMKSTTITSTIGTTTGTSTHTYSGKGIIQLFGLFLYLLEDTDDGEDERCFFIYDDDDHIDKQNNITSGTTTTTVAATTTPTNKMDVDQEESSTTFTSQQQKKTSSYSSQDGKSAFYRFVIKGGLKWSSEMLLHLVQLLILFNNNNGSTNIHHHDSYNPASTGLSTPSKDNVIHIDDNDEDNDNNGSNTLSATGLASISPSTLSKPRHYFHCCKQPSASSTSFISFSTNNTQIENEILIRISLLVDLFMRVSFIGYLYHYSHDSDDNNDLLGGTGCDNEGGTSSTSTTFGKKKNYQKHKQKLQAMKKNYYNRLSNRRSIGSVDENNTSENNRGEGSESVDDAISSFLKSLSSVERLGSDANQGSGTLNDTPISCITGDPSSKLTTIDSCKMQCDKHMKSDKERQSRRTQVLQTIHQYIWRQSNADTIAQKINSASGGSTIESTSSVDQVSLSKPQCVLSPLASLLAASFVLSTATPPPLPTPINSSISGLRSLPSLSLLTSTLMGGMIPSGTRLGIAGTNGSAGRVSVDTIPLFTTDFPILPGENKIERIVAYLNKMTDPSKDVLVIMKLKENKVMRSVKNKKGNGDVNALSDSNEDDNTISVFKRRSLYKKGQKKRKQSSEDNLGGRPGFESAALLSSGKRRRVESNRIAVSSRNLPASASANANSDQSERQRSEEEMSSSTARAILRAVVADDHNGERDSIARDMQLYNPFSFSSERNARDSFADMMARDMMESILERRSSGEVRNIGVRSSHLHDPGFLHIDLLDRPSDNDNKKDSESKDDDANDPDDIEDDEDEDDDDCMGDGDLVEIIEPCEDEDIDSDLEEQNKPFINIHDIVEDDDIDNIIVDNGGPFEVDEDDIMLVDATDHMLASVIGQNPSRRRNDSNLSGGSGEGPSSSCTTNHNDKSKSWRKKAYIMAGMELLEAQHPAMSSTNISTHSDAIQRTILSPTAEQSLIQTICNVIKPPKKPLSLKVFMRRAPTQEEFFRGSISRNPVLISSLKVQQGATPSNLGESSSDNNEPRVCDLRQHIANDLQMADSAELLELLVGNKILDMALKLRVVFQTLWKNHLLEHSSSSNTDSSSIRHLMSSGFDVGHRYTIDESTPVSSLPPMVVTYRLAGVDGEATEDKVEVGDLIDPESPPEIGSSPIEFEKLIDKEFGLTRLATKSRGVHVLLRSLEFYLEEILQNIRRDDVGRRRYLNGSELLTKNASRNVFLKSAPCSALILLKHCAKLQDNRKKMVNSKAPTILLRLLLEVLNSIDESSDVMNHRESSIFVSQDPSNEQSIHNDESSKKVNNKKQCIGNNPTADMLQELIEILASDISNTESKITNCEDDVDEDVDESTSLSMVLSSLTTTSLSPPLRKVIAKLLPFLTYGQVPQSKALAHHFVSHINFESLGLINSEQNDTGDPKTVLMDTFVNAAIHLPPVPVCNTLRSELIREGFVMKLKTFLLRDLPSHPPPWSAALFSKSDKISTMNEEKKSQLEQGWSQYYSREGLQTGFNILIGLSKGHNDTQCQLAEHHGNDSTQTSFLDACHWIENTSDNSTSDISTNGLGILAETLLDTLLQGNEICITKIHELRKATRNRKKELAQERRSKALVGMSAFGPLVGSGAECNSIETNSSINSAFSPLAYSLSNQKQQCLESNIDSGANGGGKSSDIDASKPAWMLEMEAMEDETGLICAVCQEGRTLQPTELLGLYAFVKKVSIPYNKGGMRGSIDGTLLLLSLPFSLPLSLRGTNVEDDWFIPAKSAATILKSSSHGAQTLSSASSASLSSRPSYFLTTVTAGNAIHCSCHSRARAADRNHPKAPKREWEGASLRNSRVSCNVILPLVSKKNSKVPVMSLENAFADHQAVVSTMLGSQPKSMLWTMLHDVRLLLLRLSYGEALNLDCGGGSITSNCALIYYMLFMADLFAKEAELDSPGTVQHAKLLTSGFLAASSIVRASDYKEETITSQRMRRGLADCAPMVSICCLLFDNESSNEEAKILNKESSSWRTNPKRNWELYKDHFLCGLIRCAGRRHALCIDSSGCESSRGSASSRRTRSASFNEWDIVSDEDVVALSAIGKNKIGKSSTTSVEGYATALRPMLTFFAAIDQISKDFSVNMEDEAVEESAERLVHVIEECQKADDIRKLMSVANISIDDSKILEEIECGISTVQKML